MAFGKADVAGAGAEVAGTVVVGAGAEVAGASATQLTFRYLQLRHLQTAPIRHLAAAEKWPQHFEQH